MGSITETLPAAIDQSTTKDASSEHREPLKLKGVLEKYEHFDVTPVIGREYPTINLKEVLDSPNADEMLRDLAITSQWFAGTATKLTCYSFPTRGCLLPQTR